MLYRWEAMTRGTRVFGSTMIGAMFGTILVPFIVDLVRYVKARGRQ